MAWDDDKSTAGDPDNPAADEQVTADEWDAMVADQNTRTPAGTLAERPAPGDVPTNSQYAVTGLTYETTVLTQSTGAEWRVVGFGDGYEERITNYTAPLGDAYGVTQDADTVGDDSVVSKSVSGRVFVLVIGPREAAGFFDSDTDSLTTIGVDPNIGNAGNQTLSGSTGGDGVLSVSRASGSVYVENRLGESVTVDTILSSV
jgi:hypothetical protein